MSPDPDTLEYAHAHAGEDAGRRARSSHPQVKDERALAEGREKLPNPPQARGARGARGEMPYAGAGSTGGGSWWMLRDFPLNCSRTLLKQKSLVQGLIDLLLLCRGRGHDVREGNITRESSPALPKSAPNVGAGPSTAEQPQSRGPGVATDGQAGSYLKSTGLLPFLDRRCREGAGDKAMGPCWQAELAGYQRAKDGEQFLVYR